MPPGPWGLPFIGVGLKVNDAAPHHTFTEWNKQYGDVISFTLFGMKTVILSSDAAVKEAFVTKQDQFSGISKASANKIKILTYFFLGFTVSPPRHPR